MAGLVRGGVHDVQSPHVPLRLTIVYWAVSGSCSSGAPTEALHLTTTNACSMIRAFVSRHFIIDLSVVSKYGPEK